jgi:hypothetical protein
VKKPPSPHHPDQSEVQFQRTLPRNRFSTERVNSTSRLVRGNSVYADLHEGNGFRIYAIRLGMDVRDPNRTAVVFVIF